MFGDFSKPLHHPKPNHRDRRASGSTEALNRAFGEPSDRVPSLPRRSRAERRRSGERLRGRYADRSRGTSTLVTLAMVVLTLWILGITFL